ncbi:ATP-binding protein [Candidatus Kaiserbacteria bacterium]|nr:ATP-binding protein [Candidatus Kaiserbacteria bacterium]
MNAITPPWYVLTGGPCAGKTTLVNELEKRGHNILPEAARLFFEEELALGLTIEQIRATDDWLFRIAERKYNMERAVPPEETFFFDRGVPDSVAYFRLNNEPIRQAFTEMLNASKYRAVFLLDLVDFQADEARTETPEQAREIHEAIRTAYTELGYDIISVPVLPVPERADFILSRL